MLYFAKQLRTRKLDEMKGRKVELVRIHYILNIFNSVNSLCFRYDETKHRLIHLKFNSKQMWISVTALIGLTCHLGFQIVRFFQISVNQNPIHTFVFDIAWISGYGVCTAFYFELICRRNQVEAFVNMLVRFEESLGCKSETSIFKSIFYLH